MKVAYDSDDDDIIDDPGDDIVIGEDFAGTSVSPTHDDAGNLTKDADYAYVYDGWNNLVKVRAQNDADVVVGVYAYYADNRRASKTVTNRGALDGQTYFFYDGLREIEERNGAEAVTQQYVWGHEYIDQLLMIRGAGGTWFVHQDANWNVIALTTPGGDVAEEVQYQPYGLPQVRRRLAFGDADADGDVDSSDNTARTAALTTYNRTFDADFDGDVSNTSGDADKLAWDASYNDPDASVTMVVANRAFSPSGNPFLFTGRRLDAETGLYFYRFRTYHPTLKTFIQRDPLGYVDSASLYQYVGGMPTAAGDPLGLEEDSLGVDEFIRERREQVINGLKDLGKTIEAGLSIIAAVNPIIDGYQIVTGKDAITGKDLSAVERAIEAAGLMIQGGGWIIEGGEKVYKFYAKAEDGTTRVFVILAKSYGEAKETVDHLRKGLQWGSKAPRSVTPTGKKQIITWWWRNPRTGKIEESTVEYDRFGRQVARTDWTNHGRPAQHGDPHHHVTDYGPGKGNGCESGPLDGPFPGHEKPKP
ncbi:MAG: hypothetical protein FLDDKLPJ_01769 [Phycisphaerae bacterium]|nr:hypothetical protein [Phycisphaerae bacterium]